MSHRDRGHDRDRKDDRRRDNDSSRRGIGSGRERGHGDPARGERRRSRSASPRRVDTHRRDDKRGERERRKSRSRSPVRRRSRERDYDPRKRDDKRVERRDRPHESNGREARGDGDLKRDAPVKKEVDMKVEEDEGEVPESTEEDMMAAMGFSGFGTTKGQAVEGNQEGAVKINRQQTWRQYMNRRGGFNRPLDKVKG